MSDALNQLGLGPNATPAERTAAARGEQASITENEATGAPQPAASAKAGRPADMISIPKTEWEEMKTTVKHLQEGGVRKIPRVTDRLAKVTLYKGEVITKILRTWSERKFSAINKSDEDRLFAEILLEDNSKHVVDFVDLLNTAERLVGAIKKIEKKDVSVNHGQFLTQPLNPREDKNFTPSEADDIETKTDDDYTLEFVDGERKGKQIVLNHLVLNL